MILRGVFVSIRQGTQASTSKYLLFSSLRVVDTGTSTLHLSSTTRFECVCVLDLHNLTTAQLTRRVLTIIKEQAAIDAICFPEMLNRMLIVNSPSFFPPTWRLIKGWLDPRTAGKIEVISSRSACEKRLLELADEDQVPSDYGGKGPDTNETIMKEFGGDADRMTTKMLYLR